MLVSFWKKLAAARMRRAVLRPNPAALGLESLEDRTNPATTRIIATSVEFGVAPVVSVFNADGSPKFTVQAFENTFTGGVRVAVGDVNGDDTDDLIVGAGPGGGAVVKVFSGVDGKQLRSFFAGDETNRGGATVAAGDFDNDGDVDIIIGAVRNGQEVISVQDGATGTEIKSFTPFGAAIQGANVSAGDYNGDGILDIAVGAGVGGGPRVTVIDGDTGEFLLNTFAFESTFRGGVQVAMGDLDGDGKAEVTVAAGPSGGPRVVAFQGGAAGPGGQVLHSFFAYDDSSTARNGVQVSVFDINGDGRNDIVTAAGPGQDPNVRAFDGVNLNRLPVPAQFDGLPAGQLADTAAPTATITAGVASPTNTSPIAFTVAFNEDVTGFDLADLTVTNGTASNLVAVDGRTYTFDLVPADDGLVTALLPAGAVTDAAGNPNLASNVASITYDTTAPAVAVTTTEADPTSADPIPFVATFSEVVTGFTPADITVGNGTVSGFTPMNGSTYGFTVIPTGDGPVTVDIAAGAATDLAGNASTAAPPFSVVSLTTPPAVTAVAPATGPETGGTTVTITGTGFTFATAVTFGGVNATAFVINSDTQITATAPAGTGTVQVAVTTVAGTSADTAADDYVYVAAPAVTGLTPAAGPVVGGTPVTITGTGFTGATAVTFGGVNATGFTVDSDTQITAIAPAGAGTVQVAVTTIGGTSADVAADDYTYAPIPIITTVTPNTGPATGGTAVTITGTGFLTATAVTFGGVNATSFVVDSDTQISAVAPAGTGPVDVVVTTAGGTSPPAAYTYVAAPTITGLAPNTGPEAGGNTINVLGTGFNGVTAVTFGGVAATAFTVISDGLITATVPAGTGTVDVVVSQPVGGDSADTANDDYTYVAAPAITSLSPATGPGAGGTIVTITGTGFSGATEVTIGGLPVMFSLVGDTTITFETPAGIGTVSVAVTTVGGTSEDTAADDFVYVAAPTVAGLSPAAGPETGTTSVTITGTGFDNVTAVTFGGVSATNFVVDSDTQITAIAPAGTGTVQVAVTISVGGTSADTAADNYTYVAAPTVAGLSPAAGPEAGSTSVTITGTGFTGVTGAGGVTFGGVNATGYTVVSDTEITAVAPAGTGTVDVVVTHPDGGASATSPADQFTYVAAPTVAGLSPTSGPEAGSTSVTITGTGFTGVTGAGGVTFGGVNATGYTVVSDTEITAVAPAGTGTVDVVVTHPDGGASATSPADQFTYVAAPTVAGLSPTSGPETGTTSVTITGTGFDNVTAVTFGGVNATSFVVDSDTQITAIAPAGTGTVDVIVTTAVGGASANTAADNFVYAAAPAITSLTPNSGPEAGGIPGVTIFGTGFTGATAVFFGATTVLPGLFTVVSDTQIIVAFVPAGTGTVDVSVVTPIGTSANTVNDDYTYIDNTP